MMNTLLSEGAPQMPPHQRPRDAKPVCAALARSYLACRGMVSPPDPVGRALALLSIQAEGDRREGLLRLQSQSLSFLAAAFLTMLVLLGAFPMIQYDIALRAALGIMLISFALEAEASARQWHYARKVQRALAADMPELALATALHSVSDWD